PVSDAVFVHAAAPAGISAVSLHDALPILAFGIASQLHVQNAYWAAMPVWVVAQAQRGLLLERAIFRVVGTLVGAFIGFAILTLLQEPVLALIALSVWITITAGFTHLFRRANSYAALMAGITSAVVVLPSLL